MDRLTRILRAVVLGALGISSSSAAMAADPGPPVCPLPATQSTAAADALFNAGYEELEKKNYPSACQKLRESYSLAPRLGPFYYLTKCHAERGDSATAVALANQYLNFVDELPKAKQPSAKKRQEIELLKSRLAPDVPQLTVTLPAGAPPGTVLKKDGIVLGPGALGQALPADPGEHVITSQAPGGPENVQKVTLAKAEKKTVEAVVLPVPPPPPPPEPPKCPQATCPPPPPAATTSAPAVVAAPPSEGSTRPWAFAAGGVGLAGLVLGTVTGVMVLDLAGTVKGHCPNRVCDADGRAALTLAPPLGIASTVGFVAGATGLLAMGVILITESARRPAGSSPPRMAVSVAPADNGARLTIGGAW